jgi:hypothetical protein
MEIISITTFSITTFSITTFSITTFSIMTFSITTFSMKQNYNGPFYFIEVLFQSDTHLALNQGILKGEVSLYR